MVGYDTLEAAVAQRILSHFEDRLGSSCVQLGDIDALLDAMFREDALFGVLLDFQRGYPDNRAPFKAPVWVWQISGVFAIRLSDTIESDMRSVVTDLASLFKDDPGLSGLTPLARVAEIGFPEPVQINDVPFYWVPFSIDVYDR